MPPEVSASRDYNPPPPDRQTEKVAALLLADTEGGSPIFSHFPTAEDTDPAVRSMLDGVDINFADVQDRFVLISDPLRQEMLRAAPSNDAAMDILDDVSGVPSLFDGDRDPILQALNFGLQRQPASRDSLALAAIEGYQQQTNAPLTAALASMAQSDPEFARVLGNLITDSLSSDDRTARRKGTELLLANSAQWTYQSFVAAVNSVQPDQIDEFRAAWSRAPISLYADHLQRRQSGDADQTDKFEARLAVLLPELVKDRPTSLLTPIPERLYRPEIASIALNFSTPDEWQAAHTDPFQRAFGPESEQYPADNRPDTRYLDATIIGSITDAANNMGANELFASWGANANAAQVDQAARRYGTEALLLLERRISMYNALSPDLRARFTGSREPVSTQQIAEIIISGRLAEEGTAGAFLMNQPPLEQQIAEALSESRTVRDREEDEAYQMNFQKYGVVHDLVKITEDGYGALAMVDDAADKLIENLPAIILGTATPAGPLLSTAGIPKFDLRTSGIELWTAQQNALVHQFRENREEFAQSQAAADRESTQMAELELARNMYAYQQLRQNGGSQERQDYLALAMLDRYGANMLSQRGQTVIEDLQNGGLARLREAGLIQSSSLTQFSADPAQRFDQALEGLIEMHRGEGGNLDMPLLRQAALEIIDNSESFERTHEISNELGQHLATFTTFFQAGEQGTKGPEYVQLVKDSAKEIDQLLRSVTSQDLANMQQLAESLRSAAEAAQDPEAKAELEARYAAVSGVLNIVTPGTDSNSAITEMVAIASSREFSEDDLKNWLAKNGPELALATGAVALALALAPTGTPALALILATSAASVAGTQTARETLYLVNHYVADTGLGNLRQRSYAGAWQANHRDDFSGLFAGDWDSGRELMTSFYSEVELPMLSDFGEQVAYGAVGMGAFKFGRAVWGRPAATPMPTGAARQLADETLGEFRDEAVEELIDRAGMSSDSSSVALAILQGLIGGSRSGQSSQTTNSRLNSEAISQQVAQFVSNYMSLRDAQRGELAPLASREQSPDAVPVTDSALPAAVDLASRVDGVTAWGQTRFDRQLIDLLSDHLKEPGGEANLNKDKARFVMNMLVDYAEAMGIFERAGIPREAVKLEFALPKDASLDQARGWFSPHDVTVYFHAKRFDTPFQTLAHELRHMARMLDRTVLRMVDENGYERRVLNSVLEDVGTGRAIRVLDRNSMKFVSTQRALVSAPGQALMRAAVEEMALKYRTAGDILAQDRFQPLLTERAFRGDSSKLERELNQEQQHFWQCYGQLRLDGFDLTRNSALKNLFDARVMHYRELMKASGGSLYDNPDMIDLTRNMSGDVTGLVDTETYWTGSREEAKARIAGHMQGMREIFQHIKNAGVTDRAERSREVRRLGLNLMKHIRKDLAALGSAESRHGAAAEQSQSYFVRGLSGAYDAIRGLFP